jgi:3-oxoacyl-[acyl-carrier-protein] synthase II
MSVRKTRVVVTGMGVVSPIGNSAGAFRDALVAGRSGVGPITLFDTGDFDVRIAGEVKGFDLDPWADRKDARKMARFTQFAVAAAGEALAQAGLLERSGGAEAPEAASGGGWKLRADPERTGIVLGNGIGGFEVESEAFRKLLSQGPRRMPP